MEMEQMMRWLEEMYPNKTPTTNLDSFELGLLAGQRILIEQLKIKLKLNNQVQEEIK